MIENTKYKDFSLKVQGKTGDKPRRAQIELTYCCNLSCKYCYLGKLRNSETIPQQSYEMFKNIIDQLVDNGFMWSCFTGGEPMLHDDFSRFYRYAKNKGLIIMILTNGTMFTDDQLALFCEHKPFYMEIPVHALKKDIYEEITGVKGSFDKLMKNIMVLHKNEIPFKIKTKVIKDNIVEVDEVRRFAAELNVPFSVAPKLHPTLDGDKELLRSRITPSQMAEFFKDGDAFSCQYIEPGVTAQPQNNRLFDCGAARFSVCIDPRGDLSACECLRQPSVDLAKVELGDAIASIFNKLSNLTYDANEQCGQCDIRDVCLVCPGMRQLEIGNWQGKIEYFCEVARSRDEQRKRAIIRSC